MPDENLIQPKNTEAPTVIEPTTPAPESAPNTEAQASGLSDDLLKLPVLQALMAGSPAAASGTIADFAKRPEGKLIASNRDSLMQAGFGFYKSLDDATGVIFNQLYIAGDAIKAADQAGKLAEVAPQFDTLASAVSTSGDKNPVLGAANVPEGMASAPASAPPMQVSGPGQPASVQRQTATARQKNMQPGSPTSGPSPGAGRLLNSVMKPVQ